MSQTTQSQLPRISVGEGVLVKAAAEREFQLPGDDDPDSPIHGFLKVRGFDRMPEGFPEAFVYILAEDARSNEVYMVPESGIDC